MSKILFLISLVFTIGFVSADSSCGDWTSYQVEKCLKVFDTLTPFSGAAEVCQKEGATIGIIGSAEEQGLVVNNLKNESIEDNVWIGIKKNGKSFVSLDGNALKYTNWVNGRPLIQTDVDCVELAVDNQDKWLDVKCMKRNVVLCEKPQQWTNTKIVNVLEQMMKNYAVAKKELDLLKQNQTNSLNLIDAQRKELDNLKRNPVPIGFIYVQLSGQSEPHILWPQTEWNNVSPKYSGLFFRAEGGNAGNFGEIQSSQSRSLQIYNGWCANNPNGYSFSEFVYNKTSYTVNTNFYEKSFFTGDSYVGSNNYGINFRYNSDEIRPSNQAIRIWIRIK